MKNRYESHSAVSKRYVLWVMMIYMLTAVTSGCTHNNGDIGPLFGQWHVTAIDIDGSPAGGYNGNVYWSFQNHTVEVKAIYPYHEYQQGFGNWTLDQDMLALSFPDAGLQPPADAFLSGQAVMKVLELDKNRLMLRYRNAGDSLITYTLRKW